MVFFFGARNKAPCNLYLQGENVRARTEGQQGNKRKTSRDNRHRGEVRKVEMGVRRWEVRMYD